MAGMDVTLAAHSGDAAALAAARVLGGDVHRQALRELRRQLIVDMDETLITNHEGFAAARDELFSFFESVGGVDVERRFTEMDAESIERNGWAVSHWVATCHLAGARFAGRPLTAQESALIDRACGHALSAGRMYPGVLDTLRVLVDCGVPMALKTRGCVIGQWEKVHAHELSPFFGDVNVVASKSAASFRQFAGRMGFTAPVSIGDTPAMDVIPALECGFEAVLICRPGVHQHGEELVPVHVPRVRSFPEAVLWLAERQLRGS